MFLVVERYPELKSSQNFLSLQDQLAESFPWQEGDRNEIPDRVIVRHE